jgi:hypothetical protein
MSLTECSPGVFFFRAGFPFIALAFACFGLSSMTQAVSPPPDGGYPRGNTAEGQASLLRLSGGTNNTAVGFLSLRNLTDGNFNTAIGAGTLLANTADDNTATGAAALLSNTTGDLNTANGAFALLSNTTGAENTAYGALALQNNTTGFSNTAIGARALEYNTTGVNNTALGENALFLNTSDNNTAIGRGALQNNSSGADNTATGFDALFNNNSGSNNTATGFFALGNSAGNFNNAFGRNALTTLQTGDGNVALGDSALANVGQCNNNVAIGNSALTNNTVGDYNIALGFFAGEGINGSNNIAIGHSGYNGASNVIWIGNETHNLIVIPAITNQAFPGVPVVIDPGNSGLGVATSSRRFKKDIQAIGKGSQSILALKPVSFHYKNDPKSTPCFGLVAEDVESVNPALVARDKEGKPYTVRYEAVNAMLLNEFIKEHKTVQRQQKEIDELKTELKKQAAQIQKVTAHLEVTKSAPQTVLNNH